MIKFSVGGLFLCLKYSNFFYYKYDFYDLINNEMTNPLIDSSKSADGYDFESKVSAI
jgi:hypothetical protein